MRILTKIKTDTKLLTNRRGATAIEYALVASVISVAAIMSFNTLGGKVEKKYDSIDQSLKNAI